MVGYYDSVKNNFVAQIKETGVVSTVINKVKESYIDNVKSR
jgi:hypothetical protein